MRRIKKPILFHIAFIFFAGLGLAASPGALPPVLQAINCPGVLTAENISTLLNGGVPELRVKLFITTCKVDFELTDQLEKNFRTEGASAEIIVALIRNRERSAPKPAKDAGDGGSAMPDCIEPMSLTQITERLKSGASSGRLQEMAARCKVDFEMTTAEENELRSGGASFELILTILRNYDSSSNALTEEFYQRGVRQFKEARKGGLAEKFYQAALRDLEEAGKRGHREAWYEAGRLYASRGLGRRDLARAYIAYEKAGKQGYAPALYEMAQLLPGEFKTQTLQKAFKEAWREGEKGDGRTMVIYGLSYLAAKPPDTVSAVEWFQKAAGKGDPEGLRRFGGAFEKGQGIRVDKRWAIDMHYKAAKAGDLEAQKWITHYLEVEIKNPTLALEWIQAAAKQNDPESEFKLGMAYKNGKEVTQNRRTACNWFQMAATDLHGDSLFQLALCYRRGGGFALNNREMVKFLYLARESGSEDGRQFFERFKSLFPEAELNKIIREAFDWADRVQPRRPQAAM